MHNELTALEFVLRDEIGGKPVSPDNVDLPTLRGFLDEIEKVIKGDEHGEDLRESRVRVEDGSLKIVTLVAAALAASVQDDLMRLKETRNLDTIQSKRAEIVQKWQKRANSNPKLSYSVISESGTGLLSVATSSDFQHRSDLEWVAVEKYIPGRVVNAGGKKEPNIHLVLASNGKTITVAATREELSSQKENWLYREVNMRVSAEENLRTKELRALRFLGVAPRATEIDEMELDELWRKGREAWRDVKSASEWVDALRGNI
jgi:hypothetical protein